MGLEKSEVATLESPHLCFCCFQSDFSSFILEIGNFGFYSYSLSLLCPPHYCLLSQAQKTPCCRWCPCRHLDECLLKGQVENLLSASRKLERTCVWVSALTPALSAVAGPAAVPVVGVEHGDVATLMLQVRVFLELLQGLVRAHVGVGELCKQSKKFDR